jgi:hypothetical protein
VRFTDIPNGGRPVKAIETRYAGCRFRSRLEARHAVFMDHLEIDWEFEPQGFHTPAGGYLPDFYLPLTDLYVEIKGAYPSERDLAKCQHIPNLVILVGSIPRTHRDMTWMEYDQQCLKGWAHLVHKCDTGWQTFDLDQAGVPWWGDPEYRSRKIDEALTAARSARFEHGEQG